MRVRPFLLAIGSLIAVPFAPSGLRAQEAVRQVTLEEALGMAERNNPNLEQSAASVDIAGYQELTAWGSFLPNLNLSYQYSDASSGRLDPTGQAITTTSYSAQLRGSVDLFRGFRRFSDLKGAQSGSGGERGTLPGGGVHDVGGCEDLVLQRGGEPGAGAGGA